MSRSLSVLVVEDSANDAELLIRELRRAGFDIQWTRVESAQGFKTALEQLPEVILCEYRLPQFDGLSAFRLMRESGHDIPFILVSGNVGEDVAVEAMRLGVTDYLIKDRLGRLGTAVSRAIEATQLRIESRLAEERLNASELRYRRLFEAARDGILILNARTGMVDDVNPFLTELLGYSREEFLRKKVWELGLFRHLFANEEMFRELQKNEYVRYECLPLETVDGRQIDVEFVSNVYDVDGTRVIQCNIRDISQRVQAEAESRRRHAELQLILDAVPAMIFYKDREGRFLRVNRELAQLVGVPPEAFVGKTDAEMGFPDGKRYREDDLRVMTTGIPIHHREETLYVSGATRHLLTDKLPLRDDAGAIIGVLGLAVDMTRRKLAEDLLQESEARLRIVTELARVGLVVIDSERRYLFANAAYAKIFHLPSSNVLGKRVADVLAVPYETQIRPRLDHAFAGHPVDYELRLPDVNGDRYFAVNYEPVQDGESISNVVVVVMDITEQKRAEILLRVRDRAIEAATQGIIICDAVRPDCPIIYVNRGFESITGYSAAEAYGRNCRFLQGEKTDDKAVAKIREAIANSSPVTVELLNYRKDGKPFWNKMSITPVIDETGLLTHFVGIQSDVTAQRITEEQLRQSQKMDAVGQLAGGVAHDFNNLLTVIDGYAGLLIAALAPTDPTWEFLKEIQVATARAADLTNRLLAFSHREIRTPESLDLNEAVSETIKLLRRLLGEEIELDVLLNPELSHVWADRSQITQVLMNLVINARDSILSVGQISVHTKNLRITEPKLIMGVPVQPGDFVVLSVADTGCGMPPSILERIFEPFFTTKPVGKGTGLGLAIVHATVTQSQGYV